MSFSIVTVFDNIKWDRLVSNSFLSDFNHTCYYHSAATRGEPLLLVYEEKNDFIILPVLKETSGALISHGGPLSNKDFASLNPDILQRFESTLNQYIDKHHIKSAQIRLHPLIHKDFYPESTAILKKDNDDLLVDLSLSQEEQQQAYGEDFGTAVSLLKRKGYTVRQAVAVSEVDAFSDIFKRNMSRQDPDTAAFYDKAWLRQMLRPAGFDTSLLITGTDSRIAAGAVLTFCNNIMQLLLAANHENFLFDAPLQVLLNEAGMLGKTLGMRYLYLGGIPESVDALFTSKALSPETHPGFRTWLPGGLQVTDKITTGPNSKHRQPLLIAV